MLTPDLPITDDCPIDWDAFADAFHGDDSMISMMAAMYLDCTKDLTSRVESAMESRQASTIQHVVHNVKGSIGQVYARKAQALADSIEIRAAGGAVDELEPDVANLLTQIEAIEVAVRAFLTSRPARE